MNKGFVISTIFLIIVGFCVARVKYEVVFLRGKLKEIDNQIDKFHDDIRVYNAEWSYLNDPRRLKRLAEKYLPKLRPTETKQVISMDNFISENYQISYNKLQNKAQKKGSNSLSNNNLSSNRKLTNNATKAFGDFLDKATNQKEQM